MTAIVNTIRNRMSSLKFCANLNFLFTENGADILQRHRLAKENGFSAVEIGYPQGTSQDDVLAVKKETGLDHILLNICTEGAEGMQFGCASQVNAENQFKENLKKTVELAKLINCKKIHVMAGTVLKPNEENLRVYVNNLKYAATMFESENLIGVIEPINKYALPNYFLNNYETAIEVLKEVGSDNLKLMMDIFHLQHIKGNVTNSLKELFPYIGHIQIAQVPNRNEPNVEGELNFGYIFKAIENCGYSGWIGCEYKPKTNTVEGIKWVEEYGFKL